MEGIQIYYLATDGTCTKSAKSINKTISCPTGTGNTNTTGGIAFDMLGNIVVSNVLISNATSADSGSKIRIISPDGDKLLETFVCQRKASTLCFNSPDNIAFDKDCKHLFVSGENHVLVFNYVTPMKKDDKEKQIAPMLSSITSGLLNPQGIALSNNGEIYVCDHTANDLANQIKIISFNQSSPA